MQKQAIAIVSTSILALTLLGAGCRKTATPPAPPPATPQAEAPQAAPATPDPLADDLDAAIEDLNAIE